MTKYLVHGFAITDSEGAGGAVPCRRNSFMAIVATSS